MLTEHELAYIKIIAERATPGPWIAFRHENELLDRINALPCGIGITPETRGDGFNGLEVYCDGHDANFIATSREDVPALLDHIAALEVQLEAGDVLATVLDKNIEHALYLNRDAQGQARAINTIRDAVEAFRRARSTS